jgi:hypothetical protein
MEENFRCPRCGAQQAPSDMCSNCGINIARYLELKESRSFTPSEASRKRRENLEKQKSISKPPEKPQEPPSEHPPESFQEPLTGASPDEISEGEESAQEPPLDMPPHIPLPDMSGSLPREGLARIGELFSNTWETFKSRFWTLILLYILAAIFCLAAFGIFFGIGFLLSSVAPDAREVILVVSGFIGAIAGIIAVTWGVGAFICAVADFDMGIQDALSEGSQKIWSFLWIFSLLGYILSGGFLLFIVPGIIFSTWFLFSQFILAREDVRGMDALLKSKEYVSGYWFDVFLRFLLIWVISLVLNMIPLIGFILSIAFTPFLWIYIYLVYDDLKAIKGDVVYVSNTGEKAKWLGIATLGYILVPIVLIMFMGTYIMSTLFSFTSILNPNISSTPPFSQENPVSGRNVPFQSGNSDEMSASDETVQNVMVYIYSLNYKGMVMLNGEELYEIKGEEDMNYNYSGGGNFKRGRNIIDVEYESLPGDPWKLEMKIKVYTYNWENGSEQVINEWVLNDSGGMQSFEVFL